jgi:hypothetical protein
LYFKIHHKHKSCNTHFLCWLYCPTATAALSMFKYQASETSVMLIITLSWKLKCYFEFKIKLSPVYYVTLHYVTLQYVYTHCQHTSHRAHAQLIITNCMKKLTIWHKS